MGMKEVSRFLADLSENNNKEWFDANRQRYLEARDAVDRLTGELIGGIRAFDGTVGPLAVKDCIFRIYKDVRFSKDKLPYKTHFGTFIARGGKKSGYIGYYFQIGARREDNMLAVGNYWHPPGAVNTIKEDIQMGEGDFREILSKVDPMLELDLSGSYRRTPAGFPAEGPDAPFYKLKVFCLVANPDSRFMNAPGLAERVTGIFKSAGPFVDYINRAIEYTLEEK